MIKIAIKRNRFPWIPDRFKVPKEFDELTRDQYLTVVYLIFNFHFDPSKPLSENPDFRALHLRTLLGEVRSEQLGILGVQRIYEETAHLFDDMAHPVLRYVKHGKKKFHLPHYNMKYSTFLEFAMAEEYYMKYLNEQDQEALNNLVTIICRPKKLLIHSLFNDHRKKFDLDKSKHIAEKLKVSDVEKMGVFLFYTNVRKNLIESYPSVYKKKGDSNKSVDFTSHYNWIGAIHSLSDTGNFGDWEGTCNSNMHNVLHFLNYNQDKMREIEINQAIS